MHKASAELLRGLEDAAGRQEKETGVRVCRREAADQRHPEEHHPSQGAAGTGQPPDSCTPARAGHEPVRGLYRYDVRWATAAAPGPKRLRFPSSQAQNHVTLHSYR